MWRSASGRFTNLRPDKFGRIDFGRTGGKLIHLHAPVMRQKIFHLAPAMNRMLVPDHHDECLDVMQQMLEKFNDFIA